MQSKERVHYSIDDDDDNDDEVDIYVVINIDLLSIYFLILLLRCCNRWFVIGEVLSTVSEDDIGVDR